MRRGGDISQCYGTRTHKSENWKCLLICAQGELLWMVFLRVLAKKYTAFEFTFSREWSMFVKFRIQGLIFISQKLQDINFMSSWEKHRSVPLPLTVSGPSVRRRLKKAGFIVIFRHLTDEAFFPFISLYLLQSFSFNKMCGKDLFRTICIFCQGYWIEKGLAISWIMYVIIF